MKDGIITDNRLISKTEDVISPKQLKDRYLFGVNIIDNDGNEMPDSTLQEYIDIATSYLEHDLDISIVSKELNTEEKDYHANDYWEWGYFQLNNIPILNIDLVQVVYLEDPNNQPEVVLDIPPAWFRIREHDGILRLIPNNRFPSSIQVDASGTFFPELFRRHSMVPNLWRITYTSGFAPGKIPKLINAAIGLLAANYALITAGDLVIGAGISSESISLDGLAQSINTTASSENSAYSARIMENYRLLFGGGKHGAGTQAGRERGVMPILRDYYRGETFNLI